MIFKKIFPVYSENLTNSINKLSGKPAEMFMLKHILYVVTIIFKELDLWDSVKVNITLIVMLFLCHSEERIQTDGVLEQGTEEHIWPKWQWYSKTDKKEVKNSIRMIKSKWIGWTRNKRAVGNKFIANWKKTSKEVTF